MNETYPFSNTPLPYSYNALEPYIDSKTMRLHHSKHLQAYVDNLNKTLENYGNLQQLSLEQLLTAGGMLPMDIQTEVNNNAGGVYNHRFYFDGLANEGSQYPIGPLADAIDRNYGSFDNFKRAFKAAALSVFGSGYAWLVLDRGQLKITTTMNQDTPLLFGLCPILNIDLWEHAYYLKHYNKRAAYIDAWFNLVNWTKANQNYTGCFKQPRHSRR